MDFVFLCRINLPACQCLDLVDGYMTITQNGKMEGNILDVEL